MLDRIGLLERMPVMEKSSSGTTLANGDTAQNEDSEYANGSIPQSISGFIPNKEVSCLVSVANPGFLLN